MTTRPDMNEPGTSRPKTNGPEMRSAATGVADDPYASVGEAAEAGEESGQRVFTATGNDWDEVVQAIAGDWPGEQQELDAEQANERIVVNMGPQHPSTHGVLRLILELSGETVLQTRTGIGYLHTGIEKNLEFRTWTQGVTFVTRMDYLSNIFNEVAYCLAVEKLLGITEFIPTRASILRVLTMELSRVGSHLVCIATGGMELGALTVMTNGFRDRELVLDVLEMLSGLRMNNAYIRPGGVAADVPEGGLDQITKTVKLLRKRLGEYAALCNENPIFKRRTQGIGYLNLAGCMALGITGPVLRSTGLPWDLRKTQPYCGYETYDFEVPTRESADAYGRFRIRLEEIEQSLRIVEQCVQRLADTVGQPVMVADKKIAWPAQLSIGHDGQGNSLEHIRHIMGESMEALIHHFKLVTEGFKVPPGQVYVAVEAPRGELGVSAVSDGGNRPYRVHFRDPSFTNLQATAAMTEGGMVADVIVAVASLDPVMGGVDR